MRVRLINPFIVVIARIAYKAGSAAGNFDPDFQDVRTKTVDGQRVVERPEKRLVRVRAQIEDDTFKALHMYDAGNSPEGKVGIVCSYYELRRDGHIRDNGLADFDVNDRMVEIRRVEDDALVHTIKDPPGLYCIEARPISYGIGGRLNLLLLRWNDRAQSATA